MKERLKSQVILPSSFSSVQTENGRIYVVGGIHFDKAQKTTLRIDTDLSMAEVASMRQARFSAPVTLLRDNFILVAGGLTMPNNRSRATTLVEFLDLKTMQW